MNWNFGDLLNLVIILILGWVGAGTWKLLRSHFVMADRVERNSTILSNISKWQERHETSDEVRFAKLDDSMKELAMHVGELKGKMNGTRKKK